MTITPEAMETNGGSFTYPCKMFDDVTEYIFFLQNMLFLPIYGYSPYKEGNNKVKGFGSREYLKEQISRLIEAGNMLSV